MLTTIDLLFLTLEQPRLGEHGTHGASRVRLFLSLLHGFLDSLSPLLFAW
jgi:hypothetical protein